MPNPFELQRLVLDHKDGEYTELRIPQKGVQRFFQHGQEYYEAVKDYLKGDCYVGINPRLRAEGTSNSVGFFTCLVFDVDPVRPRGEPSSDVAHRDSVGIGQRIAGRYDNAIVVSSGSGCHVYIPLERTENRPSPAQSKILREWFDSEKKQIGDTPGFRIDPIWDAPRIIRVWGSHNEKSNRPCEVISAPTEIKRIKAPWLSYLPPEIVLNITEGYQRRFQKLALTNLALGRLMREDAKFDSRSEADYAFVSILVKAHFSRDEIKDLIRLNPLGRGGEAKEQDVDRIVEKVLASGMETTSLTHGTDSYIKSLPLRKPGIKTGFKTFDEIVSGLKPQKVYVMAARPTEGKTTLITQMLGAVAEAGNVCLFFPTEVGAEPIYDKLLSRRTGVSIRKFQNGDFKEEELAKIASNKPYLQGLPLIVHEDFGLTSDKIEERVREVCPDVVAIDYIQAMKYEEGSPQEIAKTMRHIKEIAGDYQIPIILASQLNRGEGVLDLRQLKGSGAIEELADVVCFLYTLDKLNYPRKVELNVMKSKYSETGPVPLKFFATTCNLEEAT